MQPVLCYGEDYNKPVYQHTWWFTAKTCVIHTSWPSAWTSQEEKFILSSSSLNVFVVLQRKSFSLLPFHCQQTPVQWEHTSSLHFPFFQVPVVPAAPWRCGFWSTALFICHSRSAGLIHTAGTVLCESVCCQAAEAPCLSVGELTVLYRLPGRAWWLRTWAASATGLHQPAHLCSHSK